MIFVAVVIIGGFIYYHKKNIKERREYFDQKKSRLDKLFKGED